MKKLGKIKLDQLNKAELSEKELNRLLGGENCCLCACAGPSGPVDNFNAMLQVVCTLHRGLAVLMDHIACRNSSK